MYVYTPTLPRSRPLTILRGDYYRRSIPSGTVIFAKISTSRFSSVWNDHFNKWCLLSSKSEVPNSSRNSYSLKLKIFWNTILFFCTFIVNLFKIHLKRLKSIRISTSPVVSWICTRSVSIRIEKRREMEKNRIFYLEPETRQISMVSFHYICIRVGFERHKVHSREHEQWKSSGISNYDDSTSSEASPQVSKEKCIKGTQIKRIQKSGTIFTVGKEA